MDDPETPEEFDGMKLAREEAMQVFASQDNKLCTLPPFIDLDAVWSALPAAARQDGVMEMRT